MMGLEKDFEKVVPALNMAIFGVNWLDFWEGIHQQLIPSRHPVVSVQLRRIHFTESCRSPS